MKSNKDEINAAIIIQRNAIKMFFRTYGYKWKDRIANYESDLDYYCYRYGINDPWQDYINYYRKN